MFENCCCCSVAKLCPVFSTPWTAARQAPLSSTISQSLLKLMSIRSVCNLTILSSVIPYSSCPQSFPALGAFQMSQLFTSGGQSIGVSLQHQSFQSNEYSGLISFRMDWLDLLAVQGTLKSLLQHHSSKASILWCSDFFMVHPSYLYMITRKTIALTIQILLGK